MNLREERQIAKTCKGLRICLDDTKRCQKHCPYYGQCHVDAINTLYVPILEDALGAIHFLLEQVSQLEAGQRIKLLTLEEIRALPLGAVIWLEYKAVDEDGYTDISLHPVMRSVCCGDAVLCDGESQTEIDAITLEPDECGSMERYWSARPTDEQREAVAWDE